MLKASLCVCQAHHLPGFGLLSFLFVLFTLWLMFSAELLAGSGSREGSSPGRAGSPTPSWIAQDSAPVRSGSGNAAGIFDILILLWDEKGKEILPVWWHPKRAVFIKVTQKGWEEIWFDCLGFGGMQVWVFRVVASIGSFAISWKERTV